MFLVIMSVFNHKLLPLEDLALRKLIANLFTKSSILLSISNYQTKYSPYDADDCDRNNPEYERLSNMQKVWEETVQVKLRYEISKLGLPNTLLPKLNSVVGPMGWQVKKWKEFHEEYLCISYRESRYFDVTVLQKLRWTALGAVDYRKTALEIIRSNVLGIVGKFKLACLYCLEDYIPIFWRELPKENKKYFYSIEKCRLETGGLGQEFWWPYITQEQESTLANLTRSYRTYDVTFHQYAFLCSVLKGNKIAAEHFLLKLTNEEKITSLMSAAKSIKKQFFMPKSNYLVFPVKKCFELLGYLLSIMTPSEQVQILKEEPLTVLEAFLVWPLQDMFLETADNIWNILPDERLDGVLFFMYENSERFGENSLKLFQEFFLRIRPEFWLGFVDRQSVPRSYFGVKFVNRGVKPLEICLSSLGAAARKRLVFSEAALNAFKKLIPEGKPDAVEVCLRNVSLSQEEKKELKEILKVEGRKTRNRSGLFKLLMTKEENPTEARKRKIQ